MSRLCWFFVLAVVVVQLPVARPNELEQSELWLADLAQAEEYLNSAKELSTYCEEEYDSVNSSECSQMDKSLAFIDVALDLVSNAKKNLPICPFVPTEEPSTPTELFRPMDCQELLAAGHNTSGVYSVWPRGGKCCVRVRCDMDTDGGGWTVIQRRGNFSKQENFDTDWQDYKHGFGNLERDFWLGNDKIFALSNQGAYSLRMDMTAADGNSAYALYRLFRIRNENTNYKLQVNNYEGTAGNSMYKSNGYMFSTKDRRNNKGIGENCADEMKGGFWFNNCGKCNPNGLYQPGVMDLTSMHCFDFKKYVGLSAIDMKIKRLGRVSSAVETNLHTLLK